MNMRNYCQNFLARASMMLLVLLHVTMTRAETITISKWVEGQVREGDYYAFSKNDLTGLYENFIFCRVNPDADMPSDGWDGVWNQTYDLSKSSMGDNNCCYLDSYNDKYMNSHWDHYNGLEEDAIFVWAGWRSDDIDFSNSKIWAYTWKEAEAVKHEQTNPQYDASTKTFTNGNEEYYTIGDKYYLYDDYLLSYKEVSAADVVLPAFIFEEWSGESNTFNEDVKVVGDNIGGTILNLPNTVPDDYPDESLRGRRVTSLVKGLFMGSYFQEVVLGSNISVIEDDVFYGSDIRSIIIGNETEGSSLKKIGCYAFGECGYLRDFTCYAPPGVHLGDTYGFEEFYAMSAFILTMHGYHNSFVYEISSKIDDFNIFRALDNNHVFTGNEDDVDWEWADDYSSAKVSFYCAQCSYDEYYDDPIYMTDDAPVKVFDSEPNCIHGGVCHYLAKVAIWEQELTSSSDDVVLPIDPNNHADLTHTSYQAPTPTSDGNIEYWYCTACGKYFSDAEAQHEITQEKTVAHMLEHFTVVTPTYDPATGEYTNGRIEYWYCSVCDKYFSDEKATVEVTTAGLVLPYFTINNNGTYVRVMAYNGLDAEITIPDVVPDSYPDESLRGRAITSVNQSAFKNNTIITKVTMGDNIKHIGWSAFFGCLDLEEIEIGSGLKKIESSVFDNCPSLMKFTCTTTEGEINTTPTCMPTEISSHVEFYGMHTGAFWQMITKRYNFCKETYAAYIGLDDHEYSPTWNWSDDCSTVTATFSKCEKCSYTFDEVILDATVTSEVTTEPTAEENGACVMTATVTFNDKQYSDTNNRALAMVVLHDDDSTLDTEKKNVNVIESANNQTTCTTLSGYTLQKDNKWSTICLPFALSATQLADEDCPLHGATIKTLSNAVFSNGTLTLNFEDAMEIEAGKPYIIKWDGDGTNNIVNPVFKVVTINSAGPAEVDCDAAFFRGIYSPYTTDEMNSTKLYLGADNTLYTPSTSTMIGSFRAYFQLNTSKGDVNGDGDVNVSDVTVMVDHILGLETEAFIMENADLTRDGKISVGDVTLLVDIILETKNIINVVVNGAEGLTFGGSDIEAGPGL